ncbi:MAG TPA: fumarylacetoacetate hydrolase family protein [Acidimicrobiales bacterium]|jgi:2-keto-4-pentenoate hydratase/2-oxohepta-3-ene-1,7-dioic acid hydratase in catechol pathway|nr:fumarylacetoacetate hydrolase family protein [Acidimicrobiales bacterium]
MHLVRYVTPEGGVAVGVRVDEGVVPSGYDDMRALIADGDAGLDAARASVAKARPVATARLLAPIDNPGKMLFLGMTYDVFREGVPPEQEPYVYARVQSSIAAPGEPIVLPDEEATVLYEGELVVVIGAPMFRVAAADAMRHVFGYTQANDVTWTQWVHGPGGTTKVGPQICLSKNADTFCPLGPDIVTPDELDPVDLPFTVTVNEEVRTRSSTAGLAWPIAEILAFLCRDMTLWPGDLVSTGTCEAKDLLAGDTVVVEFDGLGRLENPVVGRWQLG